MSILVALLSAAAGGVVVHLFNTLRDSRNAQRTKRIEYLVSAYQRLIDATERPEAPTPERIEAVEGAVADVLLLGQKTEVDAAAAFIADWADTGATSLKPLLEALRTSLRDELKLDKTPMPERYNLRITAEHPRKHSGL